MAIYDNTTTTPTYDNSTQGLATRAMDYAKREVPGTLKVLEKLGFEANYEQVLSATFDVKHEAVLAKQASYGDRQSVAEKVLAEKLANN